MHEATKARTCIWVVLIAGLVAVPCSVGAQDEVIDRVLAVVAGDVITLSDVRMARELGRVDAGGADPVRATLTQLEDRALVLAEVDRFAPPEPSPDTVDAALDAVAARFASPEAFERVLDGLGIDRVFVHELLREDLRIRAYLDQRFTADTVVSQRALVSEWIATLRRRAEVVEPYDDPPVSGTRSGTAGSARD